MIAQAHQQAADMRDVLAMSPLEVAGEDRILALCDTLDALSARLRECEDALEQIVAAGAHPRDTYSPDTPEFSREAEIARAVLEHSEARLQPGPISTPRQGGRP